MTTVIVWILMTYTGANSGIVYSPPVATREACEAMQAVAAKWRGSSSCVNVEIQK